MEIFIKDGLFFRKIIAAIRELSQSAEFKFTTRGIMVQCMDMSHICVIDIYQPIDINLTDPISLGIDLTHFNDILKLSKNSAVLLKWTQNHDKLHINVSESNKLIEFDMNLKDKIEQDKVEITELQYDFYVFINTQEFQKCMKDLSTFGDRCTILINTNVTFIVTGAAGTVRITLDDADIESEPESEIRLTFNMKYLILFAKAGITEQIVLKLGSGTPLCCEYNFENNGFVKFFLGPMAEFEEDTTVENTVEENS